MKRRLLGIGCVLAMVLAVGVAPALAQGSYVQVDYMKVAPGKDQAYVDMERNVWKPYHQALVDAGQHAWWGLYGVRSPAGSEVGYSYATVNVFSKFTDMETPFSADVLRKVYPGKDISTFGNEALATRDLVRSETWQLIDQVPEGGLATPARYLLINCMRVPSGGAEAYLQLEREMWKPIHAARVADGYTAGWQLYGLRFPNRTAADCTFGTVESYNKFANLENPVTLDMIKKVHPNADAATIAAISDRTEAVRQLVQQQLWELIDSTTMR